MKKSHYKRLFDLKGRNAIVTGGGGLLGAHFCAALADFGANVAVVDLDAAKAAETAARVRKVYGVKALGIVCDVANPSSVNKMLARAEEKLGPIRILHNNAASKTKDVAKFFKSVEHYSIDEWRKVMSVNIDGMFVTAQAVGRSMISHGEGGSIVQTASIYGTLSPDQRIYEGSHYLGGPINSPAVYSASKGAVVALTKYLATYWAGKNIRVNTLSPGGVESGQNETFKSRYSARIPMGRMGKPSEMAAALVFLASDASSYVTGQNLIVDGGLHAW